MTWLRLIGLGEVLKKEVSDEQPDILFEELTSENGMTREGFESMNIPVPDDLLEKEEEYIAKFGNPDEDIDDYNEDNYELVEYPLRIKKSQVVAYIQYEKKTAVHTESGVAFYAKETVEEIDKLMEE